MTSFLAFLPKVQFYFNPHHPQGGDICLVSVRPRPHDFNPHHPQGGDDNDGSVTAAHILFQSTPPARWWLFLMFCCSFHFYFNPHHPQGGDPMRVLLCVGLKFQSTPPARWWLLSIKQVNIVIHFNPHHPQGGDDVDFDYVEETDTISIHTTRKVVTLLRSLRILST